MRIAIAKIEQNTTDVKKAIRDAGHKYHEVKPSLYGATYHDIVCGMLYLKCEGIVTNDWFLQVEAIHMQLRAFRVLKHKLYQL